MVFTKDLKKIMAFSLVMTFLSMTFPLAALDAKSGDLKGFVYQSDGKKPVKDAVVILYTSNNSQEFLSKPTPKEGDYLLQNVPAGSYFVKIRHKGEVFYQKKEVQIKSDQTKIAYFSPNAKGGSTKQDKLLAIPAENTTIASFILNKRKSFFYWIIPGAIAATLGGVALFTPTDPIPVSPVTQ
jgi:hypothetical protein